MLRKAYDDIVAATGGFDVPPAEDAEDFWTSVQRIQRRSIEAVGASRDTGEAVARIVVASQKDPQLAALLAPIVEDASTLTMNAWKRGQAVGAVRSDVDARVLVSLVQAIKETVIRLCLPPNHPIREKDVTRVAALVFDMIRRIAEPEKTARARTSKQRTTKRRPGDRRRNAPR